jgi:nucleotide-binding universal stress UspA family protein
MSDFKILVPVDFSEHSKAALHFAVKLAVPLKASLALMYVWNPPQFLPSESIGAAPTWNPMSLEREAREEARLDFEKLVKNLNQNDLRISCSTELGTPEEALVKHSKNGFDLIVMGTHGRTGLGRLIMGSVAQHVVAKAHCPVLTVKSP